MKPRRNQQYKKSATTIVATFGAALASTYMAPPAEAAVINLIPTAATTLTYRGGTLPIVPFGVFDRFINLGASGMTLRHMNVHAAWGGNVLYGWGYGVIKSLGPVSASRQLTAGFLDNRPFPYYTHNPNGAAFFAADATGTAILGFRTTSNQLGWFRIDLGAIGGPVTYLAAAYNDTPGGSIHAGEMASVPEPGTLALMALSSLALGARELRRRRRAQNGAS